MKKVQMKRIDVFDILPSEAVDAVDRAGYEFLKEQGYDTSGCRRSHKKRAKLKKALKRDCAELTYRSLVDYENGKILIYYELLREGVSIARSRGITFIITKEENDEGKNRQSET